MATAWSDVATLDCTITYNILLHQWDQALRGVSPLVSLEERERLRTAPFEASSLFDELATKHSCGLRFTDPRHDGMLLCHCHSHVSSPFWPLEDMVQDVPFTNEEDDDTGYDYLCPRTQAPVSPTVMRPSTLDPLNIPRQVVVLSPLLTRKVRARLSLFCDAWRRRKCNDWVCNVLEVGFRLQFQECPLDEYPICVCRQGLYQEVHNPPVTDTVHATKCCRGIRDTTSPGCYSHLFLVPKKSGGWSLVINLSFSTLS